MQFEMVQLSLAVDPEYSWLERGDAARGQRVRWTERPCCAGSRLGHNSKHLLGASSV
jgi:hypothetical protein